ncbi:hypothetical protein QUF91_18920 [Lysinibacillus sp. G4S2]|nr:hypothetical protein [Lysinibacillus sp. G4S2]
MKSYIDTITQQPKQNLNNYYAATTLATCASTAVLILFAPTCAAAIPVNVPVLTHHSLPS